MDRDPEPGVLDDATLTATGKGRAEAYPKIVAASYPPPPTSFVASADVQTLMTHFEEFVAGQQKLLDMGYRVLSFLQRRAGGRKAAAAKYRIDLAVLDKLGTLTSEHGDEREARKFDATSTLIPLSDKERGWIDQAVRVLIHRLGEYDYDPSATLPTITMAGLPQL